jgi:hypothetical protein
MDARGRVLIRKTVRQWLGVLAVVFITATGPHVSAQVSRESELKAVFVYNFAQFTEWPADVFADPNAPIVIGVLGKDPLEPYLEQAVHGEKLNNRPLAVRHFSKPGEIKDCQILFVSHSEAKQLPQLIEELRGKSILTVSDIEDFTKKGGMICLFTVNNKIRLRVNPETLKASRLALSSKLMRAAEIDSAAKEK